MSYVLYSRSTVVRAYFDKYVQRRVGATLEEVATVLGYTAKNISDAVWPRGAVAPGYVHMGKSRYYSTDEHREGWDTEATERVLEEHLSGVFRVDGMTSRAKADNASRPPAVKPKRAYHRKEDWGHLSARQAVLRVLEDMVALTRGGARPVEDIKAKLADHKMDLGDQLINTLRFLKNRGWVAEMSAPVRWYLTTEFQRLTQAERDLTLSQWDEEGNRLAPVDLAELEATSGEGPLVLLPVHPEEVSLVLVGSHHFEIEGEAYGLNGARARVEVDVPLDVSYKERLALQRFILAVREELLKLA